MAGVGIFSCDIAHKFRASGRKRKAIYQRIGDAHPVHYIFEFGDVTAVIARFADENNYAAIAGRAMIEQIERVKKGVSNYGAPVARLEASERVRCTGNIFRKILEELDLAVECDDGYRGLALANVGFQHRAQSSERRFV